MTAAPPRAFLIAVGSELLSFGRNDTNTVWLASRLVQNGFQVAGRAVARDQRGEIADVLRHALAGHELVVVTGGLGPTDDDLTREAVADVAGRTIVEDGAALAAVAARYALFNRPMTASGRRQALVLAGAQVFPNSAGMCPGQVLEFDSEAIEKLPTQRGPRLHEHEVRVGGRSCGAPDSRGGDTDERGERGKAKGESAGTENCAPAPHVLALLPGVPAEMRAIWSEGMEGALLARFPDRPQVALRSAYLYGIWESALHDAIAPTCRRHPSVEVTVLASLRCIELHLSASGADGAAQVQALWDELQAAVGAYVFSHEDARLAAALLKKLRERSWSLALAESCTGGGIADLLTDVPGASDVLKGGAVTYTAEAKERLGVDGALIREHGVVSEAVALAMARAAARFFHADAAIAVTGVAGPARAEGDPEVGTVCGAAITPRGEHAVTWKIPGARDAVKEGAAHRAMHLLYRLLDG